MVLGLIGVAVPAAAGPVAGTKPVTDRGTTTPIKHVVVIFQENVSFDHYFGTYPDSANMSGQPFDAAKKTPSVNSLLTTPGAAGSGNLLTNNPRPRRRATTAPWTSSWRPSARPPGRAAPASPARPATP
jgi:phospholipase C